MLICNAVLTDADGARPGDVRIVNPPEVCEAFEKQIHKFID